MDCPGAGIGGRHGECAFCIPFRACCCVGYGCGTNGREGIGAIFGLSMGHILISMISPGLIAFSHRIGRIMRPSDPIRS